MDIQPVYTTEIDGRRVDVFWIKTRNQTFLLFETIEDREIQTKILKTPLHHIFDEKELQEIALLHISRTL